MSKNPRKPMSRINSSKKSINSQQSNLNAGPSRSPCAEICPICMQIFISPFSISVCGHTFCRSCIITHISQKPNCPMCSADVDISNPNHLIPNHTAAALIENAHRNRQNIASFKRLASEINEDLNEEYDLMEKMINPLGSADSLDKAIVSLKKRRMELYLSEDKKKSVLLNEFFDMMISKRNDRIAQCVREIQTLNDDKKRVNDLLNCSPNSTTFCRLVPDSAEESNQPQSNTSQGNAQNSSMESEQIFNLKMRIKPSLNSLESCYFDIHAEPLAADETTTGSLGPKLEKFSGILTGISKYAKIRRLSTLNYNVESLPNSSIVSSIEFDRDGEFFVVAGVSNKIKLHEFNAVAYGDSKNHYPLTELNCSSKISNVSYNPYFKNWLSSSDYDGHVRLWDTNACKTIRTFSEHEKRCWTVQFNNINPNLMASGSDDAKIKIWSTDTAHSVCTIDAKVNVCCVYFSPTSRHQFICGAADHNVHLYDLRDTSRPLNTFCGHLKAVSYVKYCNENEIVSASVDSTLRLWDIKTGICRQVMRGHQNEKNFVGLATDGNHIICGSENNQLYKYYKNIDSPLLRYNFATRQTDPDIAELSLMPTEPSSNDFVSACCWRKNSNIVVAASSQGSTHVLELL